MRIIFLNSLKQDSINLNKEIKQPTKYQCLGINQTFRYILFQFSNPHHCVKSVRIRSSPGLHFSAFGLNTENISPYSVRMRENADQNNSLYGYFSRSARFFTTLNQMSTLIWEPKGKNLKLNIFSQYVWILYSYVMLS